MLVVHPSSLACGFQGLVVKVTQNMPETNSHFCMRAVTRHRQTDRQTDRQAGRQAGRQTGRQTDRQTTRRHTHTHTHASESTVLCFATSKDIGATERRMMHHASSNCQMPELTHPPCAPLKQEKRPDLASECSEHAASVTACIT